MNTIELADIQVGDHIRTETTNGHLLGAYAGETDGYTATEWIATQERLDDIESSDLVKSNIVRYLLNRPDKKVKVSKKSVDELLASLSQPARYDDDAKNWRHLGEKVHDFLNANGFK